MHETDFIAIIAQQLGIQARQVAATIKLLNEGSTVPFISMYRKELTKVLPILGGFCLTDNSKTKEDYLDKFVSNSLTEVEIKADTNIKYKISFEKICRMYKNAIENGFASYAEA